MKNYIELIQAPQIILEQRHGHWFSTTICMESSKSVVDGPLDKSYFNISAMT
jgi:hypothetical protein